MAAGPKVSDDTLLDRIAFDPENGIAAVYDTYGSHLLGRLRQHARLRRYGNIDVEDVFQNAILRLLDPEERAALRAAGGQILPWLSKWGYWRLDDAARHRAGRLTETLPIPNPPMSAPPSPRAMLVHRLLPLLSPRDRLILRRHQVEGRTIEQLAEELKISKTAAKKAAHDARRRLRALMQQAEQKQPARGDENAKRRQS
jgi:RNA polymerase sigma factor (sigma-70 family)